MEDFVVNGQKDKLFIGRKVELNFGPIAASGQRYRTAVSNLTLAGGLAPGILVDVETELTFANRQIGVR